MDTTDLHHHPHCIRGPLDSHAWAVEALLISQYLLYGCMEKLFYSQEKSINCQSSIVSLSCEVFQGCTYHMT